MYTFGMETRINMFTEFRQARWGGGGRGELGLKHVRMCEMKEMGPFSVNEMNEKFSFCIILETGAVMKIGVIQDLTSIDKSN